MFFFLHFSCVLCSGGGVKFFWHFCLALLSWTTKTPWKEWTILKVTSGPEWISLTLACHINYKYQLQEKLQNIWSLSGWSSLAQLVAVELQENSSLSRFAFVVLFLQLDTFRRFLTFVVGWIGLFPLCLKSLNVAKDDSSPRWKDPEDKEGIWSCGLQ